MALIFGLVVVWFVCRAPQSPLLVDFACVLFVNTCIGFSQRHNDMVLKHLAVYEKCVRKYSEIRAIIIVIKNKKPSCVRFYSTVITTFHSIQVSLRQLATVSCSLRLCTSGVKNFWLAVPARFPTGFTRVYSFPCPCRCCFLFHCYPNVLSFSWDGRISKLSICTKKHIWMAKCRYKW